jgi:hypothetical protein
MQDSVYILAVKAALGKTFFVCWSMTAGIRARHFIPLAIMMLRKEELLKIGG